jgi:hypothetical protein
MNSNYKYKYKKYKLKYLNNNKINNYKIIGGSIQDYYYKDNKLYKVFVTDDNKRMSYYEEFRSNIDLSKFTTNLKRPQIDKILLIDTIELFDHFTNKYGLVATDLRSICIQWEKVANDYAGFYLDQSNVDLMRQRGEQTMYKMYRLTSWVKYEYTAINVIIFDK